MRPCACRWLVVASCSACAVCLRACEPECSVSMSFRVRVRVRAYVCAAWLACRGLPWLPPVPLTPVRTRVRPSRAPDSVFVLLFTTMTLMNRNDSGTNDGAVQPRCVAASHSHPPLDALLRSRWRVHASHAHSHAPFRRTDLFFFTDALQKQLVTGTAGTTGPSFDSITTVADAYAWMEGPLVATLYSAVTFDGDNDFRALHSGASGRGGAPNFPG